MFRRLKEKISEEVKQSPLRQYSPFKEDSVVVADGATCNSATSNAAKPDVQHHQNLIDVQESNASLIDLSEMQPFSIGDDDGVASESVSPTPPAATFENVDLSDVRASSPLDSARSKQRTSSVSSSSGIFPMYNPPTFRHSIQSDLESGASEVEDSVVNLDVVSKDQLYQAFQKSRSRYHKYKSRCGDVIKAYKDQINETDKVKNILSETQDKALRRISELKEQSLLEQKAKLHLEENYSVNLEEKEELIRVLQTQVRLLKFGGRDAETVDCDSTVLVDLHVDDEKGHGDIGELWQPSQSDLETKLRLHEDTISKLKNLLRHCKEAITKEKETVSELRAENEALAAKVDESSAKIESLLAEHVKQEANFAEELQRAAEKVDQLKLSEEEHALSMAEAKQHVHEEMEVRERTMHDLKLQLQGVMAEKLELESSLQEKSKLILELEAAKYDDLDRAKQQLEKTLEDEKQSLLQEMSRGKAAAVQLLQQETEKRLAAVKQEKSDALSAREQEWQAKYDALEEDYKCRLEAEEAKSVELQRCLEETKGTRDGLAKELLVSRGSMSSRERNLSNKMRCLSERVVSLRSGRDALSAHLSQLQDRVSVDFAALGASVLSTLESRWRDEAERHASRMERVEAERDELKGALRAKVAEMERHEKRARAQGERIVAAEREKSEALDELVKLKQQLERRDEERRDCWEQRTADKENGSDEFRRAIGELSEAEEEEEQRGATSSDWEALRAEVLRLSREADALRESIEGERRRSDDLEQSLAMARAKLASTEEAHAARLLLVEGEVVQHLDEVKAENDRVSMELKREVAAERGRVAELASQLSDVERDHEVQLLEVNQRLALELEVMKRATDKLNGEVEETRRELQARKAEYTEHIELLRYELEAKVREIGLLRVTARDKRHPDVTDVGERSLSGGEELAAADDVGEIPCPREGAHEKERAESVKSSLEKGTLKEVVHNTRTVMELVKEQLVGVRNELLDDRKNLESKTTECHRAIELLRSAFTVCKENGEALERQRDECTTELAGLRAAKEDAKFDYENRILSLDDKIADVERRASRSCEDLASARQEIETMSIKLEESAVREQSYATEIAYLYQRLEGAENEFEERSKNLENELHNRDAEIGRMTERLDVSERAFADVESKQEMVKEELASKSFELERLVALSRELKEEVGSLTGQRADLEIQLAAANASLEHVSAELRAQLEASRLSFRTLQEETKSRELEMQSLREEKASEIDRLRIRLEETSRDHEAELLMVAKRHEAKVENLEKLHRDRWNDAKQKQKAKTKNLIGRHGEKMAEVESRLARTEHEKQALHQEVLDAKQTSVNYADRIDVLLQENSELAKNIEQFAAARKQLESTLVDSQRLHVSELNEQREKIKELTAKIDELESCAVRQLALEQEKGDLEAEICSLLSANEECRRESEVSRRAQDSGKIEWEAARSELRNVIEEQKCEGEGVVLSLEKDRAAKEAECVSLAERLKELCERFGAREMEFEERMAEMRRNHAQELEEQLREAGDDNQEKLSHLKKKAEQKLSQIKRQMQCDFDRARDELEAKVALLERRCEDGDRAREESTRAGVEYEGRLLELEGRLRGCDESHRLELSRWAETLEKERGEFVSEKKCLLMDIAAKNHQIDESLINAQMNHVDLTNKLQALEAELEASNVRASKAQNAFEELGGRSAAREAELEERLRSASEEHTSKIKQLTKEFTEMIAAKEEERRLEVANAIEQSLNEDNRRRRDHARHVEEMSREVSERERGLSAALEEKDERLEAIQSRLESMLRSHEEGVKVLKTEHRQQMDTADRKWRLALQAQAQNSDAVHREEVDGLTEEWELERKELQRRADLATSVVESGDHSSDLLRRQVVAMQTQMDTFTQRHRNEVAQLKDALTSHGCPLPQFDSGYDAKLCDQHLESLEVEYLKNVLFEYMMGNETLTLTKVIAAVMRFTDEQTNKVLRREEARGTGVGGQLAQFLK